PIHFWLGPYARNIVEKLVPCQQTTFAMYEESAHARGRLPDTRIATTRWRWNPRGTCGCRQSAGDASAVTAPTPGETTPSETIPRRSSIAIARRRRDRRRPSPSGREAMGHDRSMFLARSVAVAALVALVACTSSAASPE